MEEEELLGWFNMQDTVLSLRSSSSSSQSKASKQNKKNVPFFSWYSFICVFFSFVLSCAVGCAFLSLCFPICFFLLAAHCDRGSPLSLHTLIHFPTHSFF